MIEGEGGEERTEEDGERKRRVSIIRRGAVEDEKEKFGRWNHFNLRHYGTDF